VRGVNYKKMAEVIERHGGDPGRSTYLSELGRGLALVARATRSIELAEGAARKISVPTEEEWRIYIKKKNKRDREAAIRGRRARGALGVTPGLSTSVGIASPGY